MRRDTLITDARLRHIVTVEDHRAWCSALAGHVVTMDGDARKLARQSDQNPSVLLTSVGLAYINYTSGSTGQPKGVLISHVSVSRLVRSPNYVRLDASTRLLQFAPLSFDAATFEIWGALVNGGSLVVMPPPPVSLEELGRALSRYKINTLWLTAGLFHEMVHSALDAFAKVHQLLAGGDTLSADDVKRVVTCPPTVSSNQRLRPDGEHHLYLLLSDPAAS